MTPQQGADIVMAIWHELRRQGFIPQHHIERVLAERSQHDAMLLAAMRICNLVPKEQA